MPIITIDCGASFIKAARISEVNGDIEKVEIVKTPTNTGLGQFRIVKTVEIVRSLIHILGEDYDELKIGFSTEMHGFLIADKEGKPITDYISWQDECGNERFGECTYIEAVRRKLNDNEINRTGMPIKAGLPNVNLFYQLNNQLRNIPKDNMFFYTLGDYFIRILSGKEPYIHTTNAAATGIYDLINKDWNYSIINKLGMGGIHFPRITDEPQLVSGKIYNKTVYYYPAIGDQQAALLGSGLKDMHTVSLNFGTGAQVSALCKDIDFSYKYQTRPFFNGVFIRTIPHIPSGRALNVYFNFIKNSICAFSEVNDDDIWNYILKEVKKEQSGNIEIDMSFFTNAITNNVTGSISNIKEKDFTVGNLFLSVFKRITENARNMYDCLKTEQVDTIIFSGGVVRKNELLRTMMMKKFEISNAEVAENETLKGVYMYILNNYM